MKSLRSNNSKKLKMLKRTIRQTLKPFRPSWKITRGPKQSKKPSCSIPPVVKLILKMIPSCSRRSNSLMITSWICHQKSIISRSISSTWSPKSSKALPQSNHRVCSQTTTTMPWTRHCPNLLSSSKTIPLSYSSLFWCFRIKIIRVLWWRCLFNKFSIASMRISRSGPQIWLSSNQITSNSLLTVSWALSWERRIWTSAFNSRSSNNTKFLLSICKIRIFSARHLRPRFQVWPISSPRHPPILRRV